VLGRRVQSLVGEVQRSGFRVQGAGRRVRGAGLKGRGLGPRVHLPSRRWRRKGRIFSGSDLGFRVSGLEFKL